VVFGIRAGRAMRETKGTDLPVHDARERNMGTVEPVPGLRRRIQRIAWEKCGILRAAQGLQEARSELETLAPQLPEERSIHQVALLIARCALAREESRGAHFRTDYPGARDAFARHSIISRDSDVTWG
jgi:L-aspartate oxidase